MEAEGPSQVIKLGKEVPEPKKSGLTKLYEQIDEKEESGFG